MADVIKHTELGLTCRFGQHRRREVNSLNFKRLLFRYAVTVLEDHSLYTID